MITKNIFSDKKEIAYMWYFYMNNGEKIPFELANSFKPLSKKDVVEWIHNQYYALGKWYSEGDRIINLDNVSSIEKE